MEPRTNHRYAINFRLLLASLILFSCIGCDQATKNIATKTLQNSPGQSYLADTVRLEFALNSGGFLSLGADLPAAVRAWIFIGLNSILMLGVTACLLLNRNASLSVFVSIVFILAGGVGNQIDRITNHGLVTDFINLGIGPLRTGIFNVADVAMIFGTLAVIVILMRSPSGASGAAPRGQKPAS